MSKKTLIIMLLAVITLTSLKAQGIGNFNKIRDFSIGNDYSTIISYSERRDSMLIFMGTANGQNGNIVNNFGGNDVFIYVTDTSGNMVFQKIIGGNRNDILGDVVKDNFGNYHLFISSDSPISGNKSVTEYPQSVYPRITGYYNIPYNEVYHVVLDSSFTTIAEYTYPFHALTSPLTPPPSGNTGVRVYNIGAVYNDVTNTTTLAYAYSLYTNPCNGDCWGGIITHKIDLQGNIITTSFIPGTDYNGSNQNYNRSDLKKFPSGEIILLTNHPNDPANYLHANFFKMDENGQILQSLIFNAGVGQTNLYGVEKLNNGNLLVIANCKAIIANNRTVAPRIGTTPINNNDIWVFELDAAYNIINEWAYGTNFGIKSDSKITTSIKNNHLIVFTSAFGSGLDKTQASVGGSDYWLLDIDLSTMLVVKDKSFGGTADENTTDMLLTENSMFIIGQTKSNVSIPDKITPLISTNGGKDAWIVEVTICNVQPPLLTGSTLIGNPPNSYFSNNCNAENYTLSIDNPNSNYTYNWTDNNYNIITTGTSFEKQHPTSPYSGTITQNNYVRAINNTNGCISDYRLFQTRYAEYLPAPSLFNAPLPTVCKNDSVLLVADVSGMYNNHNFNWYQNNDSIPFTIANNTYSLPLYDDTTAIYLSTNDSTCQVFIFSSCFVKKYCESQRLEIKVLTEKVDPPVTNLPLSLYCIDDIASFTTIPNTNIINYKWFNNIHYKDSIGAGNSFNYTVLDTDTIYVVGYNSNGCPSVDVPLVLQSNELYPSFTTTNTNIIEGAYLYFTNTTQSLYGVTSYQWQFSDGLINQDTNTYHYFYQSGLNDVTLSASDNAGCTTVKFFQGYVNVNPCMCNRLAREGISIYPTVVDNQFTITKDNDKQYRVIMYDLRGIQYLNTIIKDYTNVIQNLNLNKGMYIIKIIGEDGFVETEKLIKL